jgi:hypothetical protein
VKAFRLLEAEQLPMLVDVPKPKAGSGQVVNKVGGAGLCHTDLALIRRKKALHALALGIKRILRFPLAVAFVVIALALAAGFGVARIKVDDSLSQLFRSDTPEFKQYEEVTRRFPSSEFDVLVVIEGKTLLARESVNAGAKTGQCGGAKPSQFGRGRRAGFPRLPWRRWKRNARRERFSV